MAENNYGNNQPLEGIKDSLRQRIQGATDRANELSLKNLAEEKDVRELNELFQTVVSLRNKASTAGLEVQAQRAALEQASVTTLLALFHASRIRSSLAGYDLEKAVLKITRSSAFNTTLGEFLATISDSSNSTRLTPEYFAAQRSYFASKFAELSAALYPNDTITFDKATRKLKKNGTEADINAADGSITAEKRTLLFILGHLSTYDRGTTSSDVGAPDPEFTDYVSLTVPLANLLYSGNRSIEAQSLSTLSAIISSMKSESDSFLASEKHRQENDSAYTDSLTLEVKSRFEEFGRKLDSASGIATVTSEKDAAIELMDSVANTAVSLSDYASGLVSDLYQSVVAMSDFHDNYSPILQPSKEDYDGFLSTATSELLAASPSLSASGLPTFESFLRNVTQDPTGSQRLWMSTEDTFSVFLVYLGLIVQKVSPGEFGPKITDFALLGMIRKGLVFSSQLGTSFASKENIERSLAESDGVRVARDPDGDRVPSPVKLALPEVEALDMISFADVVADFDPSTWEADFSDLNEAISFLILKSALRKKDTLNETIQRAVRAFSPGSRDNFKTIYLELVFRDSMQKIYDKAEDIYGGTFPEDESDFDESSTQLDFATVDLLRDYLGDASVDSEAERKLADYSEAWNYFYGTSGSILSRALLSPTPPAENLRSYLESVAGSPYNQTPSYQTIDFSVLGQI